MTELKHGLGGIKEELGDIKGEIKTILKGEGVGRSTNRS